MPGSSAVVRAGSALGRQHGAPAAPGTAMARELSLQRRGVAAVEDEAVVVEQLLAGLQVAQRLDEDPTVGFVGLAVGFAGVVDPARGVAPILRVDHTAVVDV